MGLRYAIQFERVWFFCFWPSVGVISLVIFQLPVTASRCCRGGGFPCFPWDVILHATCLSLVSKIKGGYLTALMIGALAASESPCDLEWNVEDEIYQYSLREAIASQAVCWWQDIHGQS